MTALDIITNAGVWIGEWGPGEPISAEDAFAGFTQLNNLLDSWTVERLNIYGIQKVQLTLTPGVQDYTVGPTGTFTTIGRPVEFLAGSAIVPGTSVYSGLSLLDFAAWLAIRSKSATDTIPTDVYPDQQYPNSGLHFWPIPNTATVVEFYYIAALTQFTTLTQAFLFPPSYADAITYALAVRLCDVYTKPIPPGVAAQAAQAKASMQGMNLETLKSFYATAQTLQGANREGPLPASPTPPQNPAS